MTLKNRALGNESSSFVSETSNRSKLGLILEYKNSNLFRIELIFSCSIIRQFRFWSVIFWSGLLNFFFQDGSRYYLLRWAFQKQILKDAQVQYSFQVVIPAHPFAFQKFFIELKRFVAIKLLSVGFRCKPLLPRFLALIFLLSVMSISSLRRWLVSWLTVNAAFSSSINN